DADRGREHGMRRALDEQGLFLGGDRGDDLVEADRVSQVAIPVVGIEDRRVQRLAGQRRVEGDVRLTRTDAVQDVEDLGTDLLDRGRVRSVVDRYPPRA